MRPTLPLLLAALTGLALAPYPQAPAIGSCAGPYLKDAEHLVLSRGVTTTVEGRSFVDGCQDSMSCGVGCEGCEYDDPPPTPMTDLQLRLRQHGQTWKLDTADADTEDGRLGWAAWTFDLPAGVRPGRARLLPEGAQPVEVRIG